MSSMSQDISKRINSIAAVAIVALVLIGVLAITHNTATQGSTNQKTLEVTGVGIASTAPDLAILDFAVTTQRATAARATSDNAAAVAGVMQALTSLGYTAANIQTTSYTLQPLYNTSQGQSTTTTIVGYQVWNNMEVSTSNFTLIGKTIDDIVNVGANQIQSVTFTFSVTTLASLQTQALQKAVQDANTKATTIASALNLQLTGPISISPGLTYQPYVQAFTAKAASTQIQPPSSIQVSVNVQVTYSFT